MQSISKTDLRKEVSYRTSRSGGKGGQNVNKVSSKVELLFALQTSQLFTDDEKALISGRLQSRINKDGAIQVICDAERSQLLNKQIALERLTQLLARAMEIQKPRKKVKLSKAVKAARAENKQHRSAKKASRRKDFDI